MVHSAPLTAVTEKAFENTVGTRETVGNWQFLPIDHSVFNFFKDKYHPFSIFFFFFSNLSKQILSLEPNSIFNLSFCHLIKGKYAITILYFPFTFYQTTKS